MRILRVALLAITLCAAGWPQNPRPNVDWDTISQKFEALRAAIKARDIEATENAREDLSRVVSKEWRKQGPTLEDSLQKMGELAADPRTRPGILPHLAMLAFQTGKLERAENYAHEMLQSPSDAYDSIHIGYNVLGLIALKQDDVAAARGYLMASTKTKGSKSLDRLGPNLALANALIDKGQNDVVLEYFQACKSFVTKNPKLDDWIAILKGGRAPDFHLESLWLP